MCVYMLVYQFDLIFWLDVPGLFGTDECILAFTCFQSQESIYSSTDVYCIKLMHTCGVERCKLLIKPVGNSICVL